MNRPSFENVNKIGILGAGTIGASWAAYYLARGFDVVVMDNDETTFEKTELFITNANKALGELGTGQKLSNKRCIYTSTIDASFADVEFVQENAPEDLDIKRGLFESLEAVIDSEVIIASSTSSLLCSNLQKHMHNPERIIVGHPFNPPHLIPLVEVVAGKQTDKQVVDWLMSFYNSIGKQAIHVRKECIGHIANRLSSALYREAVSLVVEGIASVEDIDSAIVNGPGLRWSVMGPHLTYHLAAGEGGYKQYLEHLGPTHEARWQDLGNPKLTTEVVQTLIAGVEDEAGSRSIQELAAHRDAFLLELLKLKKKLG